MCLSIIYYQVFINDSFLNVLLTDLYVELEDFFKINGSFEEILTIMQQEIILNKILNRE